MQSGTYSSSKTIAYSDSTHSLAHSLIQVDSAYYSLLNWTIDQILNEGGITARELAVISDEITCSHVLNYISVFGPSMTSNAKDVGAVVCMNSPNVHSYLTPQGANKVAHSFIYSPTHRPTHSLTHSHFIFIHPIRPIRYWSDMRLLVTRLLIWQIRCSSFFGWLMKTKSLFKQPLRVSMGIMLMTTLVVVTTLFGINIATHSLTHSLTHLYTHSLTYSLTHSLTHPLIHSLPITARKRNGSMWWIPSLWRSNPQVQGWSRCRRPRWLHKMCWARFQQMPAMSVLPCRTGYCLSRRTFQVPVITSCNNPLTHSLVSSASSAHAVIPNEDVSGIDSEEGWSESAIEELSRLYNAGPVITIPHTSDDWNRNFVIMKALVEWFERVSEHSNRGPTWKVRVMGHVTVTRVYNYTYTRYCFCSLMRPLMTCTVSLLNLFSHRTVSFVGIKHWKFNVCLVTTFYLLLLLSSEWVSEWMSEWVSEWVSGWVSEWLSDWLSEWVSECYLDGETTSMHCAMQYPSP